MSEIVDLEEARPVDADDLHEALKRLAGSRGYHRQIDGHHAATLVARGSTLLVSFEEIGASLARGNGLPVALDFAEDKNWSILHISAAQPTWFRSAEMFAYFDELADEAFFDEYDRVIFFGADAGGYAAAAYSVTAPGARVVAITPQATLDTAVASWDTRFPAARKRGFSGRYAYAPEMIEAVDEMALVFDPARPVDAMHAALFRGVNVTPVRAWHMADPEGAALIETLEDLGVLHALIEGLGTGKTTRAEAHRALRARRDSVVWLRRLVVRLVARGNPRLLALCCKAALKRGAAPMFRRRLQGAIDEMAARDEHPDWLTD